MRALGALALLVGLALMVAGLLLPERLRRPLDSLTAWLLPAGLGAALLGVLLICVPDFFEPVPASSVTVPITDQPPSGDRP